VIWSHSLIATWSHETMVPAIHACPGLGSPAEVAPPECRGCPRMSQGSHRLSDRGDGKRMGLHHAMSVWMPGDHHAQSDQGGGSLSMGGKLLRQGTSLHSSVSLANHWVPGTLYSEAGANRMVLIRSSTMLPLFTGD
jgi:hypothetical protein